MSLDMCMFFIGYIPTGEMNELRICQFKILLDLLIPPPPKTTNFHLHLKYKE